MQCTKDNPDSQAGGGYFGGKPTYSMLALGTGSGDGITLNRGLFSGGHGFTLNGDIYSNSTINVYPSLTTDGAVSARGHCSSGITAALGKHCDTGVSVADPNYPMPSGPLTPPATQPSCSIFGGSYQVVVRGPLPCLARAILISHWPDFAHAIRVEVGRKRKHAHARSSLGWRSSAVPRVRGSKRVEASR